MTPIEETVVRAAHRYPRSLAWVVAVTTAHLVFDVARALWP